MIILRVVDVLALTHQCHQKVSVDAFVVMEWNEREIEESKEGANDYDRGSQQTIG